MLRLFLLLVVSASVAQAACIEWTRLRGTVKRLDFQRKMVVIENRDQDVLTVPVDEDVRFLTRKNDAVEFKDVQLDQRVTLIRIPNEPKPKEETFDEMNRQSPDPRRTP
jgi:hypothetical protein